MYCMFPFVLKLQFSTLNIIHRLPQINGTPFDGGTRSIEVHLTTLTHYEYVTMLMPP